VPGNYFGYNNKGGEVFMVFYFHENHLDFISPHTINYIIYVILLYAMLSASAKQSTHITCADARFVNKT